MQLPFVYQDNYIFQPCDFFLDIENTCWAKMKPVTRRFVLFPDQFFLETVNHTHTVSVKLKKIEDWILLCESRFRVSFYRDQPKISRIMARQRNRRIHCGQGFFGSFDAPWSEWSGIDLYNKETQNLFSDLRIQSKRNAPLISSVDDFKILWYSFSGCSFRAGCGSVGLYANCRKPLGPNERIGRTHARSLQAAV